MTLGDIGWTQNTHNKKVYMVSMSKAIDITVVVNAALATVTKDNPQGALKYSEKEFQPMRVYDSGVNGILSIDNRRLSIYRMAVSPTTTINVIRMTEREAMKAVAEAIWKGVVNAEDLLVQQLAKNIRVSTITGSYSIDIKGKGTLSKADIRIQSPYVVSCEADNHSTNHVFLIETLQKVSNA